MQLRARIRRGQRDLDRVRIDLFGELDRLANGVLGFARQTQDERAVDGDAELATVPE